MRSELLENAGIPLRFVAVFIDAVVVLFPLSIVIGLMTGGGYAESGDGYANARVDVTGKAVWLLLVVAIAYYILGDALTGATLGKRMVRIRVVDEEGESVAERGDRPQYPAPRRRLFLLPHRSSVCARLAAGQRLGDRAAHTVVVRR